MNKNLLVIVLILYSVCSAGQSSNEKADRLVNLMCDCASKAKDRVEFDLCDKIVPVDSLADVNKLYFLKKLFVQCDKAFEKYWGPRRDSLKIKPCLFLQQEDVSDYNLRKSMADNTSINWTSQVKGQTLIELTDERRKFESESLAIEYINKQRKLTESEGINGTVLSVENIESAEVFNFGDLGIYYLYHVYARKGKLVCFLVVTLTKDDIGIIKSLLDRVSVRISTCK